MVGKLNSDAAAATAAAAAGPRSGQALVAQIVQRARDGGAQGEPDYVEVRAAGVSSCAGSQRASHRGFRRSVRLRAARPLAFPRATFVYPPCGTARGA